MTMSPNQTEGEDEAKERTELIDYLTQELGRPLAQARTFADHAIEARREATLELSNLEEETARLFAHAS